MSRKRIGLVRRGYSATGGKERYLARFAGALRDRGYDPVLFASPEWPEDDQRFSDVFRIPGGDPLSFADSLKQLRPWKHCDFLYSFEQVWECDYYRAGDGVYRSWLDRRAAVENRWAATARSWRANPRHGQILAMEAELFSPKSKTTIIANAEFVKHEIQQYYGKPADQIHVIYNGYKPPAVKGDPRSEIRGELGFTDHDVMLLFAGTEWDRKGLRYAIKAAMQLRQEGVRLVVAGRSSHSRMPRGPAKYLGTVPDMTPYYEAADLFILPSLYDPFSNASLEAAAHGLPVITSTANGFAEVMLHGTQGEVVEEPWEVDTLVEATRKWLSIKKRKESRDDIRQWARQFHVKDNVHQTLSLILADSQLKGE